MINIMGMLMVTSWSAHGHEKHSLPLFRCVYHDSGHSHVKGREMIESYLPKNTLTDTKGNQLLQNICFKLSEHA